ncbi:MAG: 1-deoxy-D-xylulose-5-phosphate synthase [Oscillospiraceae bacterium]|jgi:1-deoxy-D-xylulose-5-phosphate synthase|nr:1-deoxy-D-xylulose-5-phosphate synthase [Oscillospiraceae bacterium]
MLDIPNNLHLITDAEAEALCGRLRQRLIKTVSRTGGHLASNLGAVELTVALHRVFAPERDRILFDVGHQCYCHKMLTGRDGAMEELRSFGGISGFPKPGESVCDAFTVGHASTAVSAAVGMARARTLLGKDYHVIALLGDGALTGGLAYEGLSDAGDSGERLLVVLNDNGMSITQSVGGVAEHLARQRLKPQYLSFKRGYRRVMQAFSLGRHIYKVTHKIKTAVKETLLPCSLFEDMGFTYLGPVDGHDVRGLTRLMTYAKELEGPVLLHVRTVKGKGYGPAQEFPDRFHGVGRFDPDTGELLSKGGESFSSAFGRAICDLGERDRRICAVTAAMQPGTGLDGFAKAFPQRFFDVGIAEGHAVTMCAGMAKQGMIPVFAVYSTFLQRSYDMLIHDVALQNLHVVFCVDRAGLVGEDGETHHGVFDVGFLDTIPGMTVLAPASYAELRNMLEYALFQVKGPVAVRYPRGGEGAYRESWDGQPATVVRSGGDVTLAGYGTQVNILLEAAERLERENISAEVVKLNVITPTPSGELYLSAERTGSLWFYEESMDFNCVGRRVAADWAVGDAMASRITLRNLGDRVPTQGTVDQLRRMNSLDVESIVRQIREVADLEKTTGRSSG